EDVQVDAAADVDPGRRRGEDAAPLDREPESVRAEAGPRLPRLRAELVVERGAGLGNVGAHAVLRPVVRVVHPHPPVAAGIVMARLPAHLRLEAGDGRAPQEPWREGG